MKKLLYVQPRMMQYRTKFTTDLSAQVDLVVAFSEYPATDGVGDRPHFPTNVKVEVVPTRSFFNGMLFHQTGLVTIIRRERPDAVFSFANPRFLSFWTTLITARLLGIPVFTHGQGLFRYIKPHWAHALVFRVLLRLATRYVAYNDFAARSLRRLTRHNKIAVLENFVTNDHPTLPSERDYLQNGILYIGRLRENCDLERLADAVIRRNSVASNEKLSVKVIGGGEMLDFYQDKYRNYPEIVFFGEVYASSRIREIASACFIGCHPGAAGLSVTHMMSLSLPPIVHDSFHLHMGPEPAYVVQGKTGFLFSLTDPNRTLEETIDRACNSRRDVAAVGKSTYHFYRELTSVSLADRLKTIIQW
jgi:glycosyltransferase involved in cell wall biosynthesis